MASPRVAKSRTSLLAHGCLDESLAEDGLFYLVGIVRFSSRLSPCSGVPILKLVVFGFVELIQ